MGTYGRTSGDRRIDHQPPLDRGLHRLIARERRTFAHPDVCSRTAVLLTFTKKG